jgi:hypothetical protein
MHDRSKHLCTYARTIRNYFSYSLEPYRVKWLSYFLVEMFSPLRSSLSLGSVLLPYFTMLSPGMLVSLLAWRIVIWGNMFETMFGGFRRFKALSGGLRKSVVSHHAQI